MNFHSTFLAFHEPQAHDLHTSLAFITSGTVTSPTIAKISQDQSTYLSTANILLAGGQTGVGAGNSYMLEAPATVSEIIEAALVGALVGVVVAMVLAPFTAGAGSVVALSAAGALTAAAVGALVGILLEDATHLMRHLNEATQLLLQATGQLAQLLAADVQQLNAALQKLEVQLAIALEGVITLATSTEKGFQQGLEDEITKWAAKAGVSLRVLTGAVKDKVCDFLYAWQKEAQASGDNALAKKIEKYRKNSRYECKGHGDFRGGK